MIKYKCPNCGASSNTSFCYDCEKDIPLSQRFDDETESEPSGTWTPTPREQVMVYKCPSCGATCKTSHCFDCDKDLPISARIGQSGETSSNVARPFSRSTGFNINIGGYFSVDSNSKRFRVNGECFKYGDLINYELCENNSVEQKGGIGRAIVGGALFGEAGAIVGASTRGSKNMVNSLYIRLTIKSVGMRKISFIDSPTARDAMLYSSSRSLADQIISELEIISAENQRGDEPTDTKETSETQQASKPADTPELSFVLVADELLKLKQLLDMGVITQEEFDQQKRKLLK